MEGRSLVGGFGSESWQVLRRNAQSSISFGFGFSRLTYGMEAFQKSVANLLIRLDQHLFEDFWSLGLIYLLVGLTNMIGLHCFEVDGDSGPC